jgi:hypothetical protein
MAQQNLNTTTENLMALINQAPIPENLRITIINIIGLQHLYQITALSANSFDLAGILSPLTRTNVVLNLNFTASIREFIILPRISITMLGPIFRVVHIGTLTV